MEAINDYVITSLASCVTDGAQDSAVTPRTTHMQTTASDLKRIKTLTQKESLTPEESEELTKTLEQMELNYLFRQGTEEEKWEHVTALLEKDEWTDAELAFLCENLETYVLQRDQEKLTAFTTALLSEQYEERETVNGPAAYYVVNMDGQKAQALVQGCVEQGLANAYQYALAIKTIQLRPLPAGDRSKDQFQVELGEWKEGRTTLYVSMQTEMTGGWCSIQVKDDSCMDWDKFLETCWDTYWEMTEESLDVYREQGLTACAKYNYYEMIGMVPDEALNVLGICWGITNLFVCAASSMQSLHETGNPSRIGYYIGVNGKENLIECGDGLIDSIWGDLEDLGKAIVAPLGHIHDIAVSSNSTEEKALEIGLKTLGTAMGILWVPRPDEIEDLRTKEGIDVHLARVQNITGTPLYDMKEAITCLEEMTPEEKEAFEDEVLIALYKLYDKYIVNLFSEETMKEICGAEGYGRGHLLGDFIKWFLFKAATGGFAVDTAAQAAKQGPVIEEAGKVKSGGSVAEGGLDTSWYKPDGSINYPPNNGAVPGTEVNMTLKPGDTLGRYGNIGEKSHFVTQTGADTSKLALPPDTNPTIYQEFEVVKEIPETIQAEIAPWGGSVGGGLQYELPKPILQLIKEGYIVPK